MKTKGLHTGCSNDDTCPHCLKYEADPVFYAPMMRAFGYVSKDEVGRRKDEKEGVIYHPSSFRIHP